MNSTIIPSSTLARLVSRDARYAAVVNGTPMPPAKPLPKQVNLSEANTATRLATCQTCEHWRECQSCGVGLTMGCHHADRTTKIIQPHLRLAALRCPAGKWPDTMAPITPALPAGELADRMPTIKPGELPTGSHAWPNVIEAFQAYTDRVIQATTTPPMTWQGRGIVIAGGGRYYCSAYVNVRLLRHLGCQLPIEVWFLGDRGEMNAKQRRLLEDLGCVCVDADQVRRDRFPCRILNGWELKPYAILYSRFREVFYLDADAYWVENLERLYDEPAYLGTGAIFWRDPPKWRLTPEQWRNYGLPYRDEPAFESGQIVVDKDRAWRALRLTVHYCEWSDITFQAGWLYGDKDQFHVAWRKLGMDYAQPEYYPGGKGSGSWGLFQRDFAGRPVIMHRIHAKWVLQSTHFISGQESNRRRRLPHEDFCAACVDDLRGLLS